MWLEIHRPEAADRETGHRAIAFGNEVGAAAQKIYDQGSAVLVSRENGTDQALRDTQKLLAQPNASPIFEAGIATEKALAFVDVLFVETSKKWKIIEVKGSTTLRDYYIDDISFQAFIAKANGIAAQAILAYIDNQWVYQGDGNYDGLLREEDLTAQAKSKEDEITRWIDEAHKIIKGDMPGIETGRHCENPYACAFYDFCRAREKQAEYPVSWLPGAKQKELKDGIETKSFIDIRDVPAALLSAKQKIVQRATLSGEVFFDRKAAAAELAQYAPPVYFLDFETIQFAVPIWKGTKPYQQIPFQFSIHALTARGALRHKEFLDLSGENPSRPCAEALIAMCGQRGAIFAYHAAFEKKCISGFINMFPDLANKLKAIKRRIVDLLPIVRNHYYHPRQHGSWSLKQVLPAIKPERDYARLEIQEGDMAMSSYREAISRRITPKRKQEIRHALSAYCKQDTEALVEIWRHFSNND